LADQQTKTPGVFYHGSPNPFLPIIKAGVDVGTSRFVGSKEGARGKFGIYFTPDRQVASFHARPCGRIYRARLITRNPLIIDQYIPKAEEAAYLSDVMKLGHDCVINAATPEVIVFSQHQISYVSRMPARVKTQTPGVFWVGSREGSFASVRAVPPVDLTFLASDMAAELRAGPSGRLFEAQLVTRNPRVVPSYDFDYSVRRWRELKAMGHDAIVDSRCGDVRVFDQSNIRFRSRYGFMPAFYSKTVLAKIRALGVHDVAALFAA
jgi:hypothetical protein